MTVHTATLLIVAVGSVVTEVAAGSTTVPGDPPVSEVVGFDLEAVGLAGCQTSHLVGRAS